MSDCAFDEIAFDDVAFDTCQPTPPPVMGKWSVRKRIPPITDDDDSLLAAWMMYFMQPYQDEEL
jgi:hypothetical protein